MSPILTAFLAEHGFDPARPSDLQPDRRFTPLMRACKAGRLDVVDALLTYGVDVNVTNADGCNALWLACYNGDHGIIDRLLQAGIDIDRQNDTGATCLMYVASNSKPDLVKLLLARGANSRLKNHDDFSALDLAASLTCLKLLKAAA